MLICPQMMQPNKHTLNYGKHTVFSTKCFHNISEEGFFIEDIDKVVVQVTGALDAIGHAGNQSGSLV